MVKQELIQRSPVRVFEKSIHGGLKSGDLGVIASRKGLYSYFGGVLSATVRTGRAMSAMRFPDVPRLTADEVSCFMYFDSLPKRPGVALGMQLQTGDLQFVSNFVTVHTRTAFVDDAADPARQRHLLRLWISRPEGGRPLCPEYAAWRSGYPT